MGIIDIVLPRIDVRNNVFVLSIEKNTRFKVEFKFDVDYDIEKFSLKQGSLKKITLLYELLFSNFKRHEKKLFRRQKRPSKNFPPFK